MPTVLITGANRGIGLEFVRQYAVEGWQVIATCRVPPRADALNKLAQKSEFIQIETLDVSDGSSIATLAQKLRDTAIDILINNAGILSGVAESPYVGFDDESQILGTINSEAWQKVLHINTVAPLMVTQAFLSHVRRGKNRKIIMISSEAGSIERGHSGLIAYRSSKAALNSAMRNIAFTLQPEKIMVAGLHPGWAQTDMGGRQAAVTIAESVHGLRKVIDGLTIEQTGCFLDYTGRTIAW